MNPSATRFSLHPTAVFLAVLIYVGGVVSLASPLALALAVVVSLVASGWLAGGLRPLRAALWIIPFGGVTALLLVFFVPGGGPRGLALLLRLAAAVLPVTAVTARLGVPSLLEALDGLHVPGLFLSLIGFTLRYTEVLADESRRMVVARRSRGFARRRALLDRRAVTTYGQLLGVLLLRAKERSERVYFAMLSRGYRSAHHGPGRPRPPLVASAGDALFFAGALVTAVALKLWDLKLWERSLRP